MSTLVDRFMKYLDSCGLSIRGPRDGDPDDRLYIIGPVAEKTPEVMDALKKFKPELLKRYGRKPQPAEGTAYGSAESDRLDAYAAELMRDEGTTAGE